MTTHDIYTIITACDRARARAIRQKREAEEWIEKLEALKLALAMRLREGHGHGA